MKSVTSPGLTTVEAADRLGVSPEEVYELIFAGELRAEPDEAGVVRVTPDAIRELEASGKAPAG
jgi:excisionase family DNA binding protein